MTDRPDRINGSCDGDFATKAQAMERANELAGYHSRCTEWHRSEVTKPVLSMSLWKAVAVFVAAEILIALAAAWLIRHAIF